MNAFTIISTVVQLAQETLDERVYIRRVTFWGLLIIIITMGVAIINLGAFDGAREEQADSAETNARIHTGIHCQEIVK